MRAIAGSGRMRFPATDADAELIPGIIRLGLAGQTGPLVGGVYVPAHWGHNFPGIIPNPPSGISGLLQEVMYGSIDRVLAVRALGTGDAHASVILAPLVIFTGAPGEEITIGASVALNGTVIGSQNATVVIPNWVVGFGGSFNFELDLAVVPNDEITAGVTVSKTPAIYAYSGGTGQQTRFIVSGSLAGAPPEDEPSFAMRGSGIGSRPT